MDDSKSNSMSTNQLYAVAWKVVGVIICVITLSVSSCVSNTNYQTRAALDTKVDPILISCAFARDTTSQMCTIAAARDRK